jgi:hypothetical protein
MVHGLVVGFPDLDDFCNDGIGLGKGGGRQEEAH